MPESAGDVQRSRVSPRSHRDLRHAGGSAFMYAICECHAGRDGGGRAMAWLRRRDEHGA
jgi:hypothetical protein